MPDRKAKKSRKIIIIFGIIAVIAAFYYFFEGRYQEDKPIINCAADSDCRLYECSHCGLDTWVDKTDMITDCEIRVPGLVGCKCVDGVCKRKYEK